MKSFRPSKKKLEKAKKDGKVLKSQLVTQMACLVAGLSIGIYSIYFSFLKIEKMVKYCLIDSTNYFISCAVDHLSICFQIIFVTLLSISFVAIAVEFLQVRWMFEPELAKLKFNRINLINAIKLFPSSLKSQLIRALAVILFITLSFSFFTELLKKLGIYFNSRQELLIISSEFLVQISFIAIFVFILAGLADYFVRRKEFLKDLSMDFKEMKDESRNSDGDPYIKALRFNQHQQILQEQIVARVKKSRVVLVN